MASQPPTAPNNIIEGFKQLCDLLRHEESIFWKRIETFLLISTGLIGILGFFERASQPVRAPFKMCNRRTQGVSSA